MSFFSLPIFWFCAIWMYHDLKSLRRVGVPVRPGLIAGFFVLGFYAVTFFLWFSDALFFFRTYGELYVFLRYAQPLLFVIFTVAYFLWRARYQKIAAQGNPPLPPAPRWAFWFFVCVLVLPLLIVLAVVVFFFFVFRF